MRPTLLVPLVLAAAVGCRSSTEPAGVLHVDAGGSTFTRAAATGVVEIPFTVVNDGGSPVFVYSCGGRPEAWAFPADGTGPTVGICFTDSSFVRLRVPAHFSLAGSTTTDASGRLRLTVLVASDSGGATHTLLSAPFDVK